MRYVRQIRHSEILQNNGGTELAAMIPVYNMTHGVELTARDADTHYTRSGAHSEGCQQRSTAYYTPTHGKKDIEIEDTIHQYEPVSHCITLYSNRRRTVTTEI
jgi:hypothetical protein